MGRQYVKSAPGGFTLVELMIVIAIIGVLAAISLPQYNAYRMKTKASKLIVSSRACAMRQQTYCQGNNTPVAGALNTLDSCIAAPILPSGEPVTIIATDTCAVIVIDAGALIEGTAPYLARCTGAYNTNITCTIIPAVTP